MVFVFFKHSCILWVSDPFSRLMCALTWCYTGYKHDSLLLKSLVADHFLLIRSPLRLIFECGRLLSQFFLTLSILRLSRIRVSATGLSIFRDGTLKKKIPVYHYLVSSYQFSPFFNQTSLPFWSTKISDPERLERLTWYAFGLLFFFSGLIDILGLSSWVWRLHVNLSSLTVMAVGSSFHGIYPSFHAYLLFICYLFSL
jgi:hypothetical protein